MKACYLPIVICVLAACSSKPAAVKRTGVKIKPTKVLSASYKTKATLKAPDTAGSNDQLDAYADYYVIVADTGTSYYTLHNKMFDIHQSANLAIDTMERFYNKTKDLIQLPDNSDDEVYAGDYLPRRFPSQNLSLEYLNVYKPEAKLKTIALIAGIYETKASADSAFNALKSDEKAFVLKSKIYVGCMH